MWGVEVLAQDVLARVHALQPATRGFLLLHDSLPPSHPMDHLLGSVDELATVLDNTSPIVLVVLHNLGLDLPRLAELIASHNIAFVWIDTVSHAPLDFPAALAPATTTHLRLTHTYVYASFATTPVVQHWLLRPLEDPVHVYGRLVAQDLVRHGRGLESVPLQLALVVLRLLHYSPSIFLQYLSLLAKKIPSLTTSRLRANVRTELLRVFRWPHVPEAIVTFLHNDTVFQPTEKPAGPPTQLFEDAPPSTDGLSPVSVSPVWASQKDFYRAHGLAAWSANLVPYGVSSSMFIAEAYARVVLQFLLDCHSQGHLAAAGGINAYVIEGGSGCCKFGLAFARHLLGLLAGLELLAAVRPCIVLTDLSAAVLDSRLATDDFQSLLGAFPGQLDFAVLDVEDVIAGKGVHLRVANAPLAPGPATPLFFVGNYFLDSLPTDVFLVEPSGLSPVLTDDGGGSFAPSPVPVDPTSHYEMPALNATLAAVPRGLRVSLLLYPVQALRFLAAILPPAAPFGLLFGDATVHQTDSFHHVPELSPHADCFCLPVDFSLVETFLRQSFPAVTFQSTLQVFADTFQVCCATHFPGAAPPPTVPLVFEAELQVFGANDCDLIMGTIQDAPETFAALEPQMALLALSKWDYDCFAVFMWPMARQLVREPALRASVGEVGLKCFENAYLLKDAGLFNLHLNMARWLYAVQAFDDAAVLLKELVPSEDPRVLYLLGLVCLRLNVVDKAYVLFRACHDTRPEAKYKKRLDLCDYILRSAPAT
ncbi:hypothetical protein ACHHYP_07303 [Achlya hypogyna]|uniref:Uncharacterized protein n=1 Tax=Achlya hypogyna TaxID=1202772 RepID=A0A1V9YQX0_ACHHY|nr:hypothetical protein ACHHYP_07303 [Achlya hypogyna]